MIEERTFRTEGGACKPASGEFGEHHIGVFSDTYRSFDFLLKAKKKKKDTDELIYKIVKEP